MLDLSLRFRVHLLEDKLRSLELQGIIDVTPGVRSLQIHYDNRQLSRAELLDALEALDRELPSSADVTVPSRTVYMPLSWNDPATQLAQAKYMHSVRPDAPWCPDNIEFIRRINGLDSVEQVSEIVHAASYLVLGLGDVYSGRAGGDPYRPEASAGNYEIQSSADVDAGERGWDWRGIYVRLWHGGARRLSASGADGARCGIPIGRRRHSRWVHHGRCVFFDQIRFYPVTSEELLELRRKILHGGFDLAIEEGSFNLLQYQEFLTSIEPEAEVFRSRQQKAFREERERWRVNGLLESSAPQEMPEADGPESRVEEGCEVVTSPMTASVFQVTVEPGQEIEAGARLIVLDAMMTEIVIAAPRRGRVEEIPLRAGQAGACGAGISGVTNAVLEGDRSLGYQFAGT